MPRPKRGSEASSVLATVIGATLIVGTVPAKAEYKSPDVVRAENQLKMVLALNHLPCAEIVYVGQMEGSIYAVTCIKRTGRPAKAHYAISATNMAVVSVR